uniref:ribosomal protein L32 n=1 Tax=Pereskia aculeata TaxID=3597 RepID=UPI002001A550|nr:ribosomal protein L32 [Pereskia aculeata]UOU85458.1 ribosomal protein L32 [Pereskia aculeata]WRH31719.1 ribosomal protein L32 [Pereskia aculeata]
MAVPKKRTSISKKHIRKNIWKKKGYWAALKAFSIAKSLYSGNSTLFIEKINNKIFVEYEQSKYEQSKSA